MCTLWSPSDISHALKLSLQRMRVCPALVQVVVVCVCLEFLENKNVFFTPGLSGHPRRIDRVTVLATILTGRQEIEREVTKPHT